MPLTRERLDIVAREIPGRASENDVLYMHPDCHRDAMTRVYYSPETGLLHLVCAVCSQGFAMIGVAGSPVD